jgi:hypothetical protein
LSTRPTTPLMGQWLQPQPVAMAGYNVAGHNQWPQPGSAIPTTPAVSAAGCRTPHTPGLFPIAVRPAGSFAVQPMAVQPTEPVAEALMPHPVEPVAEGIYTPGGLPMYH